MPPRLLRPGHITAAQIEATIGPIERQPHATGPGAPLPSPGMLQRHYAPRTPAEVYEGSGEFRVLDLVASGSRVGWLTHIRRMRAPAEQVVVRQLPNDPKEYATRLYSALHELDEAQLDRIVIDLPPDTEEWLAVRDRLRRAAG